MRPILKTLALVLIFGLLVGTFAIFTLVYARKVSGTSMYPTLEEGDMVVVVKVPYSSLAVGDVIVYDPPCSNVGDSVIHRIVGIQPDGLITKGDNNHVTDQAGNIASGPVTASCIEGEVVFVVPYVELLTFLPYGANYVIAVLIVVLLVLSELYPRKKEE